MWVQDVAERVENESKEEEKCDKDEHHDVKNFFAREAIREASEYVGEEDRAREDSPNLDERDGFSARFSGRYDHRVFENPEQVVVKRDKEEHSEHGKELLQLPSVDGPEKCAPLAEFCGIILVHKSTGTREPLVKKSHKFLDFVKALDQSFLMAPSIAYFLILVEQFDQDFQNVAFLLGKF